MVEAGDFIDIEALDKLRPFDRRTVSTPYSSLLTEPLKGIEGLTLQHLQLMIGNIPLANTASTSASVGFFGSYRTYRHLLDETSGVSAEAAICLVADSARLNEVLDLPIHNFSVHPKSDASQTLIHCDATPLGAIISAKYHSFDGSPWRGLRFGWEAEEPGELRLSKIAVLAQQNEPWLDTSSGVAVAQKGSEDSNPNNMRRWPSPSETQWSVLSVDYSDGQLTLGPAHIDDPNKYTYDGRFPFDAIFTGNDVVIRGDCAFKFLKSDFAVAVPYRLRVEQLQRAPEDPLD